MLKTNINSVIEKIYIFILTFIILLPISPLNSPYSFRDSGFFLYAGWRILFGELPYKHFWDHKPPLIFYLNALGLTIFNQSKWGVWLIEFVSLFLAACIGYYLLKKMFGFFPAAISTLIWTWSFFTLMVGGNLTTEYTLPLQFGALYLFFCVSKKQFWHYVALGVLGGIAFCFKQPSIGVWIAIGLYLFVNGIKNRNTLYNIKLIGLIGLGFVLVFLLVGGVFLINNAFYDMVDASLLYNLFYTSNSHSIQNRLFNMFLGLDNLTISGIYYFAILGVIAFLFRSKTELLQDKTTTLLNTGLIIILIEIFLINLPGFTSPHYFLTILPGLSLFVGYSLFVINSWMSDKHFWGKAKTISLIVFVGLFLIASINNYWKMTHYFSERTNEPAIFYVIENTEPEDTVLLWGAESMVNFFSKRASPTRYVYQYPLYHIEYSNEDRIIEFLDDIISNRPVLIIDTHHEQMPIFQFPISSKDIDGRINRIITLYEKRDVVNSWDVYHHVVE